VTVPRIVGRYALYGELARGGMATVHFGRLLGPVGFSRTVAIKRLHPQFAVDPEFVSMFLDEARLAARIRHPNVVSTLDVVALEGELMLVMEYVQGESLSRLIHQLKTRGEKLPVRIAISIMSGILSGLHAAHEAKSERGEALGLVHRDMSPQNVLVGVDGVARVLDFGIAKATGRVQTTRDGQFKGKLAYVAPEQLKGNPVDRRTDVYAASVILWEMLTLHRLFKGDTEFEVMNKVMSNAVTRPSQHVQLPPGLDELVMRGLAGDPAERFGTAREMAIALESLVPAASPREVEAWAELVAGDALRKRAQQVEEIETASHHMIADSGIRDLTGLMANAPNSQRAPQPPPRISDAGPLSMGTPPMASTITNPPSDPLGAPASVPSTDRAWQPSQPPPQKSRAWMVALFIVLLGGGAAAAFFLRHGETQTPSTDSAAGTKKSDDEGAKKSQASTTDEAPTAEPTTTASTESSAAPPLTATAATTNEPPPKIVGTGKWPPQIKTSPTATATTAASAKPSVTATAPPPAPTETAVAAKCNPPYTIDAQGIRHPKPDCL
jgi:serine/threonine protein kinase